MSGGGDRALKRELARRSREAREAKGDGSGKGYAEPVSEGSLEAVIRELAKYDAQAEENTENKGV